MLLKLIKLSELTVSRPVTFSAHIVYDTNTMPL